MCPYVEPLLYRPNLLLISTKVLMSNRKAWLRSSLAIANVYSTEGRGGRSLEELTSTRIYKGSAGPGEVAAWSYEPRHALG